MFRGAPIIPVLQYMVLYAPNKILEFLLAVLGFCILYYLKTTN